MQPPPNELYTAFAFIGFVMCAIPVYWHLEARNMGTCLYMSWTGLGCLIQCINSIVWNKNMINRAPVYCDIATRIQIGLNGAIPACSLCINRRLYKVATNQGRMATREEKRRGVIVDLLICLGIPILQMVSQYIVSGRRYMIFEDFGPFPHTVPRIPTVFLFSAWPIVIGSVSLVYGTRSIYHLYKHQGQLSEVISSGCGLNRSLYIRLMMFAGVGILGTVPLSSFCLALTIKRGLTPWVSWADVHSSYSVIYQVPSIVWKHDLYQARGLEMFRWLLVLCAFLIFVFFGFVEEAWKNYCRVYRWLASLFGYSSSSGTSIGSSDATSSLPPPQSKAGGVMFSDSRVRRDSTDSFSDQLSTSSISTPGTPSPKPYLKVEEVSLSESTAPFPGSSSAAGSQGELPQVPKPAPVFVPAFVPPRLRDIANSTIRRTPTYSSDAAVTV